MAKALHLAHNETVVECVRREPLRTIAEPACGTGSFFFVAYDFIIAAHKDIDNEGKRF